MTAATKSAVLLHLARKGPVRARDLAGVGVPRAYLQRLCDQGILARVDRGVYELADAPATEFHSLAQVAKRVPRATICLLSALQAHGLTSEAPHAVWILIDSHARVPKLAYPKIEVVRASGSARDHGVELRKIEGVAVRLTTPAKTVADCFRYRRHVGLEVAIEALRGYLAIVKRERGSRSYSGSAKGTVRGSASGSRKGARSASGPPGRASVRNPMDELVAAATADRVLRIMRPYLEAL